MRLPQFAGGFAPPDPQAVALLARPEAAHFRSVPSSPNSDQATAQTIGIMCRHIEDASRDPLVRRAAVDAPLRFRGGPAPSLNSAVNLASSDWWWVKHALQFIHHEYLIRQWLHEADQLQLLIPPEVVLRMREPQGDCAVFTMLVCALLRCQGIPYEVVTVATNAGEPRVFSHVYARAVIGDLRLPLDASHGDYPGWQVPSRDIFRIQVWDASGNPIKDTDARYSGLHGYRGLRGVRRGLGDAPGCNDYDWNPALCAQADVSEGGSYVPPAGTPSTIVPTGASPSGGFNIGSTLTSLLGQWTKIAGNVIAPTVSYTRGPNGQIIYNAPANAAGAVPASILGGSGSSWLIIAGVLVAGVVAVKAMSGK